MSRASELVQPGVLKWTHAAVTIRVSTTGRNVGILVEDADGRRYFQVECGQAYRGTVVLVEVPA